MLHFSVCLSYHVTVDKTLTNTAIGDVIQVWSSPMKYLPRSRRDLPSKALIFIAGYIFIDLFKVIYLMVGGGRPLLSMESGRGKLCSNYLNKVIFNYL